MYAVFNELEFYCHITVLEMDQSLSNSVCVSRLIKMVWASDSRVKAVCIAHQSIHCVQSEALA